MVKEIFVSLVLVWRNLFRLIFYPYATMRKINQEKDWLQVGIIFFLVYLYFIFASAIRNKTINPLVISHSSLLSFILFLLTFSLVVIFFNFLGWLMIKTKSSSTIVPLIFSFSYSLLPTLIWFFSTSLFYLFLPPPRTFSILGKLFSLFFVTFSIVLLFWKTILFYLSLRFSLKLEFYQILYAVILFLIWFLPYSVLMYQLKIFRIPFI